MLGSLVKFNLVKGYIYMNISSNYARGAQPRVRTYEEALRLERSRERHHRETPQGAFEAKMLSLDLLPVTSTQDEYESWMSDRGAGAEAIVSFEDESLANYYHRKARAALERVRCNLPECVPTLRGVLKNGSNREETIWEMAKGK